MTRAGGVLGRTLPRASRSHPSSLTSKGQGQRLGIPLLKGRLPLVWAEACFSHLFSHKSLSSSDFFILNLQQLVNRGTVGRKLDSHFWNREPKVLSDSPSTDTSRAKPSSYFRPLDLTLKAQINCSFISQKTPSKYSRIIITYLYIE